MSKEVMGPPRSELPKEISYDPLWFKFEVRGLDNLEFMREGIPGIFAFFPHRSHLDTLVFLGAFPGPFRGRVYVAVAEDYWYTGLPDKLRFVLNFCGLNTFPMSRTGVKSIETSLNRAQELLNAGFSVGFSPEGTRSSLPLEERRFRRGLAELVLRTHHLHIPVVPVRLFGLRGIMPKGTKIPRVWRLDEVSVCFGEPMFFDIDPEASPAARKQQRRTITAQLREQFLAM